MCGVTSMMERPACLFTLSWHPTKASPERSSPLRFTRTLLFCLYVARSCAFSKADVFPNYPTKIYYVGELRRFDYR